MKNLILAFAVLITGFVSAQEVNKPTMEKKGDLIQATYYHDNGAIAQEGFFNKNNKVVDTNSGIKRQKKYYVLPLYFS